VGTVNFKGKSYEVDSQGFLVNRKDWDENFTIGIAPKLQITQNLTEKHQEVIRYMRNACALNGVCPTVYETCNANGLSLDSMKQLFPTGYLRGACVLAGLSYKECYLPYPKCDIISKEESSGKSDKTYRVDVRGFLIDPSEWDEDFAIHTAYNLKMQQGLTAKHWKIINYIRDCYKKNGVVPGLYQTCSENQLDLEELERLFPDGYHRGAVKISGLRAR
jgi:TusE/DsrC/DsvC family sulfur relay protein